MNYLSTVSAKTDTQTSFKNLLQSLVDNQSSGCLQVVSGTVTYFIYLARGKLIYATNSLAPFERLERHLRRLSHQNSRLTPEKIKESRIKFKQNLDNYTHQPSDYQAIYWLAQQEYFKKEEINTLLRRTIREIFESLLNFDGQYRHYFISTSQALPKLYEFDLVTFAEQCQQRLQAWQVFAPEIQSTYQRPYFVTETSTIANLNSKQNKTFSKLLTGLNFRQISALIDRDELVVARILYPSIVNGEIVVRPPNFPFNRLPKLSKNKTVFPNDNIRDWRINKTKLCSNSVQTLSSLQKKWMIACIDDSLTVRNQIDKCLNANMFSTILIDDPMKALARLMDLKPDLILLDVNMPNINGYELCKLLRANQFFKDTPIVMLTSYRDLVSRTKAKLAGATDYMTKPFTQSSLLNTIFKYLT